MNDDRIDELLASGARDYNQPGSVPREEMWARIQASRQARPAGHQPRASRPIWVWSSVGIAAALILSIGIVIGRRVERAGPPPTAVATHPVATPSKRDSAATVVAATPDRDSLLEKLHDETRKTDRRVRDLAAAPNGASATRRPADANLAYHLVVLQHLAGSEAMITAFRSAARRGEMDAQLATWSRELLSTTRMLEATAATQDPTMKRLLEDLDLVIAQIVQYTTHGTNNSDELDLIEQSITTRGVITKLRGTVSARNSAGI